MGIDPDLSRSARLFKGILGHSNPTVTLDIYTKLLPDSTAATQPRQPVSRCRQEVDGFGRQAASTGKLAL